MAIEVYVPKLGNLKLKEDVDFISLFIRKTP